MKKLLIAFAILGMMPGCKKDEATSGGTTLPITAANIAGVYKITALTGTPTGTSTALDIFSTVLSACQQDDTHEFTTTNNYIRTDAGTLCTPPSTLFTSAYTFSGTSLTYAGDTYTVESITQTGSKVVMIIFRTGSIVTPLGTTSGTVRTTLTR